MPPRRKKQAAAAEIADESGDVAVNSPAVKKTRTRSRKAEQEEEEPEKEVTEEVKPKPRSRKKKQSQVDKQEVEEVAQAENEEESVAGDEKENEPPKSKKAAKPWQKKKSSLSNEDSLVPPRANEPSRAKKRSASMVENEENEENKETGEKPLVPKAVLSEQQPVAQPSPAKKQKRDSPKAAPKRQTQPSFTFNPPATAATNNVSQSKPKQTLAPFTFKMEVAQDTKDIEAKFKKLKELRETRAEKELREYKAAAEKRFKAADELIAKLTNDQESGSQKMDEEDEEQLEELRENVDQMNSELEAAQNEIVVLRAKLLQQQSQDQNVTANSLELVSDLSGLVVKNTTSSDDETLYECTQSGRNGVFHYTLGVSSGADNEKTISFTPNVESTDDERVLSLLPDYFSEPLSFQANAAPQFYWKLSQALHKRL